MRLVQSLRISTICDRCSVLCVWAVTAGSDPLKTTRRLISASCVLGLSGLNTGDSSKAFLWLLGNTFSILILTSVKYREGQITPQCFNTPSARFWGSLSLSSKFPKTSNNVGLQPCHVMHTSCLSLLLSQTMQRGVSSSGSTTTLVVF